MGTVRNWTVSARWQSVWALSPLMVSDSRMNSNNGDALWARALGGKHAALYSPGAGGAIHSGHVDKSRNRQFKTPRGPPLLVAFGNRDSFLRWSQYIALTGQAAHRA